MMRSGRIGLSLFIVFGLGPLAFGADWPQWRGLNRDGHSPETGLLKEWPAEGLKPLWVAGGLGRGYSSVAVANGRIYTTGMAPDSDEGFLFAFDLNGTRLWKKSYGPDWNDMYPGSRACPTVEGDRAYILSGVGRLFCFDAVSGEIRWTRNLANEFGGITPRCGFVEGLCIEGDLVVCTPGGKDAAFVGLNKRTGETVWASRGFTDMSAYCSPIRVERGGTRQLVTVTARHVVGFDPRTGEIFWSRPFDTEAEDPNHSNTPVYHDGVIYIMSGHRNGGQAYKLSEDGRSAEEAWADEVLNPLHSGAVAVGGYVYGANPRGHWVCLEIRTGKLMYDAKDIGPGSVIHADGMLYCYGEKGALALVPATPTGFEPVSRFRIAWGDDRHWAHPAISDGRLYIRRGDALMAFDVKAP